MLFTFLQNEETEAQRVMYLAQLGRVGLGSETLSPGHTHMLKYSKCKVTETGLGAEWSGDQGPVRREAASLSIGPVCGQS